MEARRYGSRSGQHLAIFFSSLLLITSLDREAAGQYPPAAASHAAQSQNFVVFASSPAWAEQVAKAAEQQRRDLAVYWLGEELPPWPQRCPLHVHSGPTMGASGETRFMLLKHPGGGAFAGNWTMVVAGTPQRVLDSVLPHEISHTIFATHFGPLGKYVPRWADEGACTTVEHDAEKSKHRKLLHDFLKHGKGLSFNHMFSLKEYPDDILPLYSQGHSAVQFMLDQGGPRKFVKFLERGLQTEQWEAVLRDMYAYQTLGEFQSSWNQWLADGSPQDLTAYAPGLRKGTADQDAFDPQRVAAVQLASQQMAVASEALPLPPAEPVVMGMAPETPARTENIPAGEENWYKNRLRAYHPASPTQRAQASLLPSHPQGSGLRPNSAGEQSSATPPPAPHQSTRPMQPQSTPIQVLQWGQRGIVPGIERR